ncbi:MFS transporter [Corynebacterium macginleyi]|uniref:MFS transporter n=1 Tax=Corynebacterium macginleyi TaxID=38290 RepID=UPI00190DE97F|nr:MFS transporter [Corynebacterium macginleyi]MBK4145337.1 MFS transporter [Corynebacterium macginleyi]
MLNRNERLDRLPVTSKHKRLLLGSGLGWALDAMDVGLISFIMAALAVHWDLSSAQTSWLASASFLGMALGATFGGLLADKYGRRHVFSLTLLVYGLATGASALASGLALLIVLRFIIGLGLGAELPVASTLISEFSPRRIRGRMVVLLEAFWALGWILAALIGTFIVGVGENGWRWGFAVGLIPAVYSLYVRLGLPESVRFLESKGRHEEAEEIVVSFEKAAAGKPLDDVHPEPTTSTQTSIWGSGLRRRTAALWTIWFCVNFSYYGAFIWIPSLLVADGFSLVKSFSFTLIITLAQLPGYATAAWLIEVWGRRFTLSVFLIGSAAFAGLYGTASSAVFIIIAGCLLSFFNLGAWGALYAIGPELYPTALRGRGTGAAAGFGRISSIVAPLVVPPLISATGAGFLFVLFAAAFAIAAIAACTLPELKGAALA